MSATIGNADIWTVVFRDANGVAADPDGPVTWTITRAGRVVGTVTQTLADATEVGTFELTYTPDRAIPYRVKVRATVGGADQASAAIRREVTA